LASYYGEHEFADVGNGLQIKQKTVCLKTIKYKAWEGELMQWNNTHFY